MYYVYLAKLITTLKNKTKTKKKQKLIENVLFIQVTRSIGNIS